MDQEIKDPVVYFRTFIKKKRLRNTSERDMIIREIFAEGEHFDVETLYARLRKKQKKVCRVSIYRTIPLLLESGLIQESFYRDGRALYEPIFSEGHHCHIRCLQCGRVEEYCLPELEGVERKLSRQHGYSVTGHRLEVYGYCPDCLDTPPPPARENLGDR
jgi:Fur family ferric uptake transcriptional regulator